MDTARTDFGITLTYSTNKCTVLTSQVKVIVLIMSEALFTLGARLCKISFFEMKWSISSAKSTISSSGIVCKWVLQFQPDGTYLTMARDISHTRYWYSSSAINIIRRVCTWRARCTKCVMRSISITLSVSHFLSIVCRSQGLLRVDPRDIFIHSSTSTWWRVTNYIFPCHIKYGGRRSPEWLILHLPWFLFNWFFFLLVELGQSPREEFFSQLTREDFHRGFVSLPTMDLSSIVFANSIDPFSLEAIDELGDDRLILSNDTLTMRVSGVNFLQFIKTWMENGKGLEDMRFDFEDAESLDLSCDL